MVANIFRHNKNNGLNGEEVPSPETLDDNDDTDPVFDTEPSPKIKVEPTESETFRTQSSVQIQSCTCVHECEIEVGYTVSL